MKKQLCIFLAFLLLICFISGCGNNNQSFEAIEKIAAIDSPVKLNRTKNTRDFQFDVSGEWETKYNEEYDSYTIFPTKPNVMITVSATEVSMTEDEFFAKRKELDKDLDLISEKYVLLADNIKSYNYSYNYISEKDNEKSYCEFFVWLHDKYSCHIDCMGDYRASESIHAIINNIACSVRLNNT
jgi:hypothetical protein